MGFYRPLVKLLVGMADISLNSTTSPEKMHALCLAVEQIYYTRNLTFIGPFSFSTSLVKWPLHGSKSSHALDGCCYPSGSVTTLQKFLRSSSQDENKCFESDDVEVWADNTQRKGKTSRVREDGTTPISIAMWFLYVPTLLLIYRRYMNCPLDIGIIPKKISLHLYISLSSN